MPAPTVNTRLVQLDVRAGRPVENTTRMLEFIATARADGVGLIVFPEMAIPGYLIADEWERPAFLRECAACGEEIRAASRGIVVIFGNVAIDWDKRNEDGRVRKYTALFTADNGRFIGPAGSPYDYVIKTLQPNYREFDESRHFYDLRKLAQELDCPLAELLRPVETSLGRLGCVLCEDAWHLDYNHSPLDLLAEHAADLYVNISASPFTANKNHKRNRVFSDLARRLGQPLIYVNNVGIQNNGKTVFTFDGASCIYDGLGKRIACGRRFEESVLTFDIPRSGATPFGDLDELAIDTIGDLHTALVYGTRKFMELCGVNRVTVGVSGGIDSAVVAALYAEILEPRNLLLINMPGAYTSGTTRRLARELARNLGCYYAELPIEESVALTCRQVDGLALTNAAGSIAETLELSGLARENVQARDRSSRILAAVASAFGGVFTCNANKSEVTVGYTTLYGDLCGYLANVADLWKTEVYELAAYINQHVHGREVIPAGTIAVTPSAELSPEQNVDEGKGDPLVYAYHDCLLRSWVESWNRTTPEEIADWYADGTLARKLEYSGDLDRLFATPAEFIADLERWWGLYQGMGLAKRIQAPPILAVKRRAFGFDHRESQLGTRYTRKYDEIKQSLLAQDRHTR